MEGIMYLLGSLGELFFGDDQRRSESDDVVMGGLGEDAVLLHLDAYVPCVGFPASLGHFDGVEKALASDLLHPRIFCLQLRHLASEDFAHILRALCQVLFLQHLQRLDSHRTCQRVPSISGTVFTFFYQILGVKHTDYYYS